MGYRNTSGKVMTSKEIINSMFPWKWTVNTLCLNDIIHLQFPALPPKTQFFCHYKHSCCMFSATAKRKNKSYWLLMYYYWCCFYEVNGFIWQNTSVANTQVEMIRRWKYFSQKKQVMKADSDQGLPLGH